MGSISGPVLPIHVEDSPFGGVTQNLVYCRRCRNRFGGAYGAISARAPDWSFCPYCGVEIVKTNPYHQPTEATWRSAGEWMIFGSPPERWDEVEAAAYERTAPRQIGAPHD